MLSFVKLPFEWAVAAAAKSEKCVIHLHGLPFTVCSSLFLLIGPSSKIARIFRSASCYDRLPVESPGYAAAADSGQAWCVRRTRRWSFKRALPARWWAGVSVRLIMS